MESSPQVVTADSPAMSVLDAVAARDGVEPSELDTPLYTAIDPDALDSLLESDREVSVSFEYEDHTVTASADGAVVVDGEPEIGGSVP